MLRSSSQSSGSSGIARSYGGWVKNTHGDRGGKVPHWCGCGLRPILWWSGTDSNPERPFYGCSNYNVSWLNYCKLITTDVEEEEAIVGRNESSVSEDHWKISLGWKISAVEAEIRILKM
ncbi:hypothetical protein Ahy_B01g056184 isoform A [Arachis hypogaea]|uniref:Zinc finger GRF-type domain-containing protein n=1 Tax=Arachis hypogaea TaxID=3818 RepID=A0A445AY75_ARAHY|nr:hypothetical protein Ahy_B01g056184 isoform A [Arachis hypogaea]